VKPKISDLTLIGHEGPGGKERYSSTVCLTLAKMGVGSQRHAPAALPAAKGPGTHCTGGWVGPQGPSRRVRKISPPPAFVPRDRPARSGSPQISVRVIKFQSILTFFLFDAGSKF
jgi:hypothetical protein